MIKHIIPISLSYKHTCTWVQRHVWKEGIHCRFVYNSKILRVSQISIRNCLKKYIWHSYTMEYHEDIKVNEWKWVEYFGELLGSIYQNWIYAILGCFSLLASVNFAALNMCIRGFVWVPVFNFLNIYLGVELLNYMIMLFNLLRCHQIIFYRGSTIFCFHQRFMRILFSTHSHQYMGISCLFFFLIIAILVGLK